MPDKPSVSAMEIKTCAATAHVHMKKQFCAHFLGALFTGSNNNARVLAPMKSTESMGAKFMALAAISMDTPNIANLEPVNCVHVRLDCTPA